MYESPIKLNEIGAHISEEIAKATDEYIFAQVNMAVDVDKEELIKALSYDRNQYQKGYADGYADAKAERKPGKWILADAYAGKRYRCSECLAFALKTDDGQENLSDYCPCCGAYMKGESND